MHVGMTQANRGDFDEHLTRRERGNRHLDELGARPHSTIRYAFIVATPILPLCHERPTFENCESRPLGIRARSGSLGD